MRDPRPARDAPRLELSSVGHAMALMLMIAVFAWGFALATGALLLLVVCSICLIWLYPGRREALFSPAFVMAVTLLAIGTLGYCSYEALRSRGYYLGVVGQLTPSEVTNTFALYLLAALSLLLGARATCRFGGSLRASMPPRAPRLGLSSPQGRIATSPAAASVIALSVLSFNIAIRDPDSLLDRPGYIIATEFGGVLTYLQLPAALLLGASFVNARPMWRLAIFGQLALLELFSLALSSRMISIVLVMFFVGLVVGGVRRAALFLCAGAFLAVSLIPVPLHLRGEVRQGLLPNLGELQNISLLDADAYLLSASNVLSSFGVVGATAFRAESIGVGQFLTALSPLPGFLSGGVDGSSLRISASVPFAGVGEVANHGVWAVPIFFGLLGAVLGIVQVAVQRARLYGYSQLLVLAPTALSLLAAILFAQYNLRTGMRMIYAIVAVAALIHGSGKSARSHAVAAHTWYSP